MGGAATAAAPGSVRFLSEEWLAELTESATTSEQVRQATSDVRLTVGHQVTGGPDGDVGFHVRIDRGDVSFCPGTSPGTGEAPDVVLVEDYETAAALSRGDLLASEALAAGRLDIRGDIGLLSRHQDALAGLGVVFDSVRSRTRY